MHAQLVADAPDSELAIASIAPPSLSPLLLRRHLSHAVGAGFVVPVAVAEQVLGVAEGAAVSGLRSHARAVAPLGVKPEAPRGLRHAV
jgi:hypothetical protein